MRMLLVVAVFMGLGCEALDLESSNDHPLLKADRGARPASMTWSVRNDNDAPARLDLRTDAGQTWSFVVPASSGAELGALDARIECLDGEVVHSMFNVGRDTQPHAWMSGERGFRSETCGAGNVLLRF
jgi:hypothetical protein